MKGRFPFEREEEQQRSRQCPAVVLLETGLSIQVKQDSYLAIEMFEWCRHVTKGCLFQEGRGAFSRPTTMIPFTSGVRGVSLFLLVLASMDLQSYAGLQNYHCGRPTSTRREDAVSHLAEFCHLTGMHFIVVVLDWYMFTDTHSGEYDVSHGGSDKQAARDLFIVVNLRLGLAPLAVAPSQHHLIMPLRMPGSLPSQCEPY
ncbi:hypothetical protein EDD36DRAFT_434172 [Exophiala viscosa]|uniref:Uncharacterized protein n=1 Tax=Exophiala viscosa TaxID=2486360 RepID=A0AAN6DWS2_9EURO|nr:hypothetical protein EDD36DRAFT_434172 [Exophiala viscosa]